MLVSFIAAPRRINYLRNTLDSLYLQHRNFNVSVFAEPETTRIDKINYQYNNTKLGCVENWLKTLQKTCDMCALNDDRFLICEDDIQFTEGVFDTIDSACSKYSDSVLSPYCSLPNGKPTKEFGWHEPAMGSHGLCGALCLCFTREQAIAILADLKFFREQAQGKYLDYAIGQTLWHNNVRLLCHMPTLIYHLGDVSAMGNDELGKEYVTRRPYTGDAK